MTFCDILMTFDDLLDCLIAFLLACLLACFSACLLARSLACFLACLLASLLACLPPCFLACLLASLLACLLACFLEGDGETNLYPNYRLPIAHAGGTYWFEGINLLTSAWTRAEHIVILFRGGAWTKRRTCQTPRAENNVPTQFCQRAGFKRWPNSEPLFAILRLWTRKSGSFKQDPHFQGHAGSNVASPVGWQSMERSAYCQVPPAPLPPMSMLKGMW